MSPVSRIYTEIAERFRRQELPRRRWTISGGVLYRLSCMDDPKLREYGIRE